MKKKDYLKICCEIEKIESEFEILDPSNSIESEKINLLANNLDFIISELKKKKKEERLNRFKIVKK